VKTKSVLIHCLVFIGFWKIRTEKRMVKNFRVVVITDVVRGPKVTTYQGKRIK